jgi:AcrR family transcriptional regulator
MPRSRKQAPLAERLVDAVDALLEEEGLAGLSLREVARRAGVTHGAPLRHYASFSTLLSEVAARGFRALTEAIGKAADAVEPGAGAPARLAAAARAYVLCAMAQPGRFALMFRPELLDGAHEPFARDALEAFEVHVRLVRAAQDAGYRPDAPTRRLAGALWAAVHGLATLWVNSAYVAPVGDVTLDASIDDLVALLFGAAPPPRRRA